MHTFGGTTAVITGAASGIGRSLVRAFAAEGAHVLAADVDQPGLVDTCAGIERASWAVCDVADPAAVDQLVETAYERLDHVGILCNNAGVFQGGLAWETTSSEWEWVLGVNLHGVVNGIRSFVPRMVAQGDEAHIVNTASMAAHVAMPLSGAYAATKAAVQALTESLAHDLAMAGAAVRAHCLVPSLIDTNIGTSTRNRPESVTPHFSDMRLVVDQALKDSTANGISPDEVAAAVLNAIRNDQFLIPTNASFTDQITARAEALVRCELPDLSVID